MSEMQERYEPLLGPSYRPLLRCRDYWACDCLKPCPLEKPFADFRLPTLIRKEREVPHA